MRNHKADETDSAGHTHCHSGEDRDDNYQQDAEPVHVDTQRYRVVVAHCQGVEIAALKRQPECAADHRNCGYGEFAEFRARDASHHPEQDSPYLGGFGVQLHKAGTCQGHLSYGNSGEEYSGSGELSGSVGEQQHDDQCDHRADEGCYRYPYRSEDRCRARGHCDDGRQGSA